MYTCYVMYHMCFLAAVLHAAQICRTVAPRNQGKDVGMQGLAVGFVLLRVEALTEEGKL